MAKKKYKQLHVPKDAPDDVKEHIRLSQIGLNIVQDAKAKKAAGNFTIKDLKALAKKNMRLAEQFPVGDHKKVGIPAIKNIKDLKAVAAKHQKEMMALLKKSGGSTITSMKELKELARKALKNPQAAGEEMIAKAREKNQQAKEAKNKTVEKELKTPTLKSDREIRLNNLHQYHLAEITELIKQTKIVYYDLWMDWPAIENLENHFDPYFDAFGFHGKAGTTFLMSYIKEEAEDDAETDELEEKKVAAALTLATVDINETNGLDELFSLWKEKPEVSSTVIQACKYSWAEQVDEKVEEIIFNEEHPIQAGCIEILDYHQKYESKKYQSLLKTDDRLLHTKIFRADAHQGIKREWSDFEPLLEDPNAPFFEDTILSALIAGKTEAQQFCRKILQDTPEQVERSPIFLACSAKAVDYPLILASIDQEKSMESGIYALGLMGMSAAVPILLTKLKTEDWQIQRKIADSIKLITGAGLELKTPKIKEGPKGKEYEFTVETGWYEKYSAWWIKNENRFDPNLRYRRGQLFNLESCIKEMDFPRGNYWSRQYSYYELQIRSGKHICRFEADGYVAEQKASIETWQIWWRENQHLFGDNPWLFSGKT